MIAGHGVLHRVAFNKKSIYCGYEMKEASRKYFELEPEATEGNPLEWHVIVTPHNPLMQVQRQLLRRAPGKPGVVELEYDLTAPDEDE